MARIFCNCKLNLTQGIFWGRHVSSVTFTSLTLLSQRSTTRWAPSHDSTCGRLVEDTACPIQVDQTCAPLMVSDSWPDVAFELSQVLKYLLTCKDDMAQGRQTNHWIEWFLILHQPKARLLVEHHRLTSPYAIHSKICICKDLHIYRHQKSM